MSNTPKPQANTLDEILEQFRNCILDNNGESLDEIDTFQQIQALITEARIDDVQNILNIRTPTNGTTTVRKKAEDRLTQLKKGLSKL